MKGQAKKDFEKWYTDNYPTDNYGADIYSILSEQEYEFSDYPFSMQFGVIVEWFDSVGIVIEIELDKDFGFFACVNQSSRDLSYTDTRHQARQKAIDKAVEIYNKNK